MAHSVSVVDGHVALSKTCTVRRAAFFLVAGQDDRAMQQEGAHAERVAGEWRKMARTLATVTAHEIAQADAWERDHAKKMRTEDRNTARNNARYLAETGRPAWYYVVPRTTHGDRTPGPEQGYADPNCVCAIPAWRKVAE